MHYYRYEDKYLFSLCDDYPYDTVGESDALDVCRELYYLTEIDRDKSKATFAICDEADLYVREEGVQQLRRSADSGCLPDRLYSLMKEHRIKAVNTCYDGYESRLSLNVMKKKRVNVMALGDVGSTLLIGLKLLGGMSIDSIGIYDRSPDKVKRWEYEMNQTSEPLDYESFPEVNAVDLDSLFDCDMFVFCASKGVPPIGSEVKDVRMVQFEANSALIKEYAGIAAKRGFEGIFAVVSDPVDPLCKAAYLAGGGKILPENIKGYGLGVMNARAAYYAKRDERFKQFLHDGRAFGPHGQDLVIADSITNYDDRLSRELTKLTVESNLRVRETGYKPYIAPALSSGAISIVKTLSGQWHYSSNYVGGVYLGARNRCTAAGIEIEKTDMPDELFDRIGETYSLLAAII